MLNNKTIFITGGTGSFGKKCISKILNIYEPKKVIIFSRDELKQFEMQQQDIYKSKNVEVRYFIGDVRDYQRLKMAMEETFLFLKALLFLLQIHLYRLQKMKLNEKR